MTVLRIEHEVAGFDAWKVAFDADPIGRQSSGVTGYRILRDMDDPSFVMVDLELETEEQARTMLTSLQHVWDHVQGTLISAPEARIAEPVEFVDY